MTSADFSVIVPTIAGRERWLERTLAHYKRTAPRAEVIVITDEKSCGLAWRAGAARATRPYVHFTADDIEPHAGWWQAAQHDLDEGRMPAANVLNSKGKEAGCLAPFDEMGTFPNILVPTLTREMLDRGDWLLTSHYGTDDWVTYRAVQLGYKPELNPKYTFTHHVASEGRDYTGRPKDVAHLVAKMQEAGYVPNTYVLLDQNLNRPWIAQNVKRVRAKIAREQQHEARKRKSARLREKRMAARLSRTNRGPKRRAPIRITAFPFKNELDVLEIRLGTIGHLFDRIVIAEATVDQRGRPKELLFRANRERFQKWLPRIEYIVVDDMPEGTEHADDVARERHQRDALIRGMGDLQNEDRVYVSDLDEIPYPDSLQRALENGESVRFGMDLFVYRLNWRWLDRGCRIGTLGAVVTGEALNRLGVCGAVLWDSSVAQLPGVNGWHLTYQGDVATLRSKITGMMDRHEALVMPGVEPSRILTDDWIERSIRTGEDIFGRTYRPSEWVSLDQLPPYVRKHPEKFAHMLISRPWNQDYVEEEPRCTCGGIFDAARNLTHFEHCALAAHAGIITHYEDPRERPRALDV